jgi:hypothetical protein
MAGHESQELDGAFYPRLPHPELGGVGQTKRRPPRFFEKDSHTVHDLA